MGSTIGEPYLLATYPVPHGLYEGKHTQGSARIPQAVYLSYSSNPKNSDGEVTIAAAGDGVHTLDLGSLHSVSSQTISPMTSFVCSPATYVKSEGGAAKRRVHVVLKGGPDISHELSRRTIWSWVDDLSGDIQSTGERETFTVDHEVCQIYTPKELRSDIVTMSSDGSLRWLSASLQLRRSWSSTATGLQLLKTFVSSIRLCSCVHIHDKVSEGVLVFSFVATASELILRVHSLVAEEDLSEVELPICAIAVDDIVDITFNSDGFMSILTQDGYWRFYQIEISTIQQVARSVGGSLQLKDLLFISQDRATASRCVSLQALSSSHVLLAGVVASSTSEIVLMIWDIQYSVLLTSHLLPKPTSLGKIPTSQLQLSLVAGNRRQSFLSISPYVPVDKNTQTTRPAFSEGKSQRSCIFVIPHEVPSVSILANAMGRVTQSAKWLADTSLAGEAYSPKAQNGGSHEELLRRIIDAMDDELPDVAASTFFSWYNLKIGGPSKPVRKVGRGELTKEPNLPQEILLTQLSHIFGHNFTCRLISAMLYSPAGKNVIPPWSILDFLLEKNLVSHSMIGDGLLPILLSYSQWNSIQLALKNVIDIPESELVVALKAVVVHHRKKESSISNAMNVDSDGVPSLSAFFALCVQYSLSATSWRSPIKEHFSDMEDLYSLLLILENWFAQWAVHDLSVMSRQNSFKPQAKRQKSQMTKKYEKLPHIENLISFLQAILDASFLPLLQFKPAHRILRKLLTFINPQITLNENLEMLRGPLEPYARVQSTRTNREGGVNPDSRKRRKQPQEQTASLIGLHQIEQLSL